MNSLLKLFDSDSLLGALLEILIASGRPFTMPAKVVSGLCAKFGVKTDAGKANVIDASRTMGLAVTAFIQAIANNRGK